MIKITDTTDRKIYNNLQRWLDLADREQFKAGKAWYREAQAWCKQTAYDFGMDPYKVAGVLSALSPNNKWARNKSDAWNVCNAYHYDEPQETVKCCTYNANKRKAFAILADEVSLSEKSPKTHSFAMNVGLLSPDHVTADKWHIRACLARPDQGVTDTAESCTQAQYRRIEAVTVKLARAYELKGYEAQAIIWVTIKDAWNR
jgi:hypothetical protein|tara:strand:- start:1328 stop:1933 length:606 start_codon:yes stop_codon:yes gene_type:complete